jgi:hypothetical protein
LQEKIIALMKGMLIGVEAIKWRVRIIKLYNEEGMEKDETSVAAVPRQISEII